MSKVAIEIDFKQIENTIDLLSPAQQKEIAKKIWALHIDRISGKMKEVVKKNQSYT